MTFASIHLNEAKKIIDGLDINVIEWMANLLAQTRANGGRLFFLGVGGSAGNCSHAVNDFRKISGIEASCGFGGRIRRGGSLNCFLELTILAQRDAERTRRSNRTET